jgi:hypothetical protein
MNKLFVLVSLLLMLVFSCSDSNSKVSEGGEGVQTDNFISLVDADGNALAYTTVSLQQISLSNDGVFAEKSYTFEADENAKVFLDEVDAGEYQIAAVDADGDKRYQGSIDIVADANEHELVLQAQTRLMGEIECTLPCRLQTAHGQDAILEEQSSIYYGQTVCDGNVCETNEGSKVLYSFAIDDLGGAGEVELFLYSGSLVSMLSVELREARSQYILPRVKAGEQELNNSPYNVEGGLSVRQVAVEQSAQIDPSYSLYLVSGDEYSEWNLRTNDFSGSSIIFNGNKVVDGIQDDDNNIYLLQEGESGLEVLKKSTSGSLLGEMQINTLMHGRSIYISNDKLYVLGQYTNPPGDENAGVQILNLHTLEEEGFFTLESAVRDAAVGIKVVDGVLWLLASSAKRDGFHEEPWLVAFNEAGEQICELWPFDDEEAYYAGGIHYSNDSLSVIASDLGGNVHVQLINQNCQKGDERTLGGGYSLIQAVSDEQGLAVAGANLYGELLIVEDGRTWHLAAHSGLDIRDLAHVSAEEMLLVGSSFSNASEYIWVGVLDAEGNLNWENTGVEGRCYSIVDRNTGLLLCSEFSNGEEHPILYRYQDDELSPTAWK